MISTLFYLPSIFLDKEKVGALRSSILPDGEGADTTNVGAGSGGLNAWERLILMIWVVIIIYVLFAAMIYSAIYVLMSRQFPSVHPLLTAVLTLLVGDVYVMFVFMPQVAYSWFKDEPIFETINIPRKHAQEYLDLRSTMPYEQATIEMMNRLIRAEKGSS